jgi:hypothetical protein
MRPKASVFPKPDKVFIDTRMPGAETKMDSIGVGNNIVVADGCVTVSCSKFTLYLWWG